MHSHRDHGILISWMKGLIRTRTSPGTREGNNNILPLSHCGNHSQFICTNTKHQPTALDTSTHQTPQNIRHPNTPDTPTRQTPQHDGHPNMPDTSTHQTPQALHRTIFRTTVLVATTKCSSTVENYQMIFISCSAKSSHLIKPQPSP